MRVDQASKVSAPACSMRLLGSAIDMWKWFY